MWGNQHVPVMGNCSIDCSDQLEKELLELVRRVSCHTWYECLDHYNLEFEKWFDDQIKEGKI